MPAPSTRRRSRSTGAAIASPRVELFLRGGDQALKVGRSRIELLVHLEDRERRLHVAGVRQTPCELVDFPFAEIVLTKQGIATQLPVLFDRRWNALRLHDFKERGLKRFGDRHASMAGGAV